MSQGWVTLKDGRRILINNYMNDKIRGIKDYNGDEEGFLVDNQNLIYDPGSATEEQRNAVREYTAGLGYGDSKLVNGYLNNTRELSEGAKELVKEKIRLLDSCINKKVNKSLYVYKGTDIKVEDLKVGKIIKNNGYTSTSIFKNDALDFSERKGTVIKLKVNSGTKALYIGENTSSYRNEHELLIERGKSIKIIKIGDEVIGELI